MHLLDDISNKLRGNRQTCSHNSRLLSSSH